MKHKVATGWHRVHDYMDNGQIIITHLQVSTGKENVGYRRKLSLLIVKLWRWRIQGGGQGR